MSTINETSGRGPAEFETVLTSAPAAAASFEEEHTGAMRRVQHFLHQYPTSVPFLVLILGIAAFTIPLPRYVDGELQFVALAGVRFFSAFNLSLILQQVTIIAVLGTAQTLVILTAGIDLSVGVIMILCSVVMGRTCVVYGMPAVDRLSAGPARRPGMRRRQRHHRHASCGCRRSS